MGCQGKKGRQSDEKKQRVFWEGESEPVWQGKCGSVSGGRFGVSYRDQDCADFRLDAAVLRPRDLSVSGQISYSNPQGMSLPTCQPSLPSRVTCHSSLVTLPSPSLRLSQLGNQPTSLACHASSCSLLQNPPHAGHVHAGGGDLQARGANLNYGWAKEKEMDERPLRPRQASRLASFLQTTTGYRSQVMNLRRFLCLLHLSQHTSA